MDVYSILLDPGILILVNSWGKRVFLLFDFYHFGVRQFLVKKKMVCFTPSPSEGGIKKTKQNLKIGCRAWFAEYDILNT